MMYQAPSWQSSRRIIAVRQHIKQRTNVNATAKGKTLSLFAEDETIGQWGYAAMVTDLNPPALQIWRLPQGQKVIARRGSQMSKCDNNEQKWACKFLRKLREVEHVQTVYR